MQHAIKNEGWGKRTRMLKSDKIWFQRSPLLPNCPFPLEGWTFLGESGTGMKKGDVLLLLLSRVISRAPGLKLVVETLISSLRPIGNIVLICCAFFIIFGILGVQVRLPHHTPFAEQGPLKGFLVSFSLGVLRLAWPERETQTSEDVPQDLLELRPTCPHLKPRQSVIPPILLWKTLFLLLLDHKRNPQGDNPG